MRGLFRARPWNKSSAACHLFNNQDKTRRRAEENEKGRVEGEGEVPYSAFRKIHILQCGYAFEYICNELCGGLVDTVAREIKRTQVDDAQGRTHDAEVQVAVAQHQTL